MSVCGRDVGWVRCVRPVRARTGECGVSVRACAELRLVTGGEVARVVGVAATVIRMVGRGQDDTGDGEHDRGEGEWGQRVRGEARPQQIRPRSFPRGQEQDPRDEEQLEERRDGVLDRDRLGVVGPLDEREPGDAGDDPHADHRGVAQAPRIQHPVGRPARSNGAGPEQLEDAHPNEEGEDEGVLGVSRSRREVGEARSGRGDGQPVTDEIRVGERRATLLGDLGRLAPR